MLFRSGRLTPGDTALLSFYKLMPVCLCVYPATQGVLHAVLDKVVSRLEMLLSRNSFNQVMSMHSYMLPILQGVLHAVLDKVVSRLETLLSRKSFNQLGGLQLDRDIRALVRAVFYICFTFYIVNRLELGRHLRSSTMWFSSSALLV